MNRALALVLTAALASAASLSQAQTSATQVKSWAAGCANCHGTNGKAVPGSGMDALAGMEKEKLLQKLKDFKSGVKPATIMHQISKGYTDEQMDLIAAYYAAQK